MAIQVQGFNKSVAAIWDADGFSFRAMRVTARGVEFGALGVYAYAQVSGTMAANIVGASEIFQMRWTDATDLCLVFGVNLESLGCTTTGFTAGFGNVDLTIARGWTADGSGGTAATLTGDNQKLRTSMGSSQMGTIRIATTAALGAGTKTLDAQPIGIYAATFDTAVDRVYMPKVSMFGGVDQLAVGDTMNPYPVVLAEEEGLAMRATVPATGTWQFGVSVNWAEVTAY